MKETPQEYIGRITGYLGEREPLDILRNTQNELPTLLANLSEEAADWRPAPERWSIRQIMAHLADVEIMVGSRLRFAVAHPGISLAAYDQDKLANVSNYNAVAVSDSLATWTAVRKWNLEFVTRLSPEAASGYGMHQERGKETVQQMLRMIAGHDLNHLRQISELAAAQGRAAAQ